MKEEKKTNDSKQGLYEFSEHAIPVHGFEKQMLSILERMYARIIE